MFSEADKKIISLISRDIPLVREPFSNLAQTLGVEEKELLGRIKSYKRKGILRKFCATINHLKAGFKYNAMAVWNVPEQSIDRAGNLMAGFALVSHCYQREKKPSWNYNLYSMIHGKSRKECLEVVRLIADKISLKDYKVLFSTKEYKKIGVRY